MKFKLTENRKEIITDTLTPVSIYLKIRDNYANSILFLVTESLSHQIPELIYNFSTLYVFQDSLALIGHYFSVVVQHS